MRLELVLVVLLGLIPLLIANFTVVSDTSAIVRYMPDIGTCDPNFAAATPWKAAVIGDKDSSIVELAQGAAYIAYTALPTEPNKDSWMEFQKTVDIPVGCAIDTAELKVASDNAQEVGIKIGALTNFFPPMGTVYGPADTTQCEACALQTYNAKPFILANQFTIRITTRNYNTSLMPCYPACAPIMNPSVTSFRLDVTFSNDVQPPSIIIGSPSNGMTYTVDNVPPLSYTATDNCDNAPNVTVTGYSHLIGIHNLKVEAEDGSGNIASQTITYTVVAPRHLLYRLPSCRYALSRTSQELPAA